jgi:short-subunit dehydrogenase
MQPEQRLVLVTGAGSGIGRALCVEAAHRGMAVALCGRRQDKLEATRALLGANAPHMIIPADITRPEDRRRIVDRLTNERPMLDFLINNAGIIEGGLLETLDDNALARTFQTNVLAPMALTRDLMALLLAAKPSRVVNVGSIFGDIGYPEFTCYSASKFALRGFSIALRREWKKKGIGVTYAAPRATRTDAASAFAGLIDETRMIVDDPEQVARQIWQAIISGQDSVYAPAPERIYVLVQRLFPRVIDWSLSR